MKRQRIYLYFRDKNVSSIFHVFGIFYEECTKQAFGTVSFYRVANFFRRRKTDFAYTFLGNVKKHYTLCVVTFRFIVDVAKLFMSFDYLKSA